MGLSFFIQIISTYNVFMTLYASSSLWSKGPVIINVKEEKLRSGGKGKANTHDTSLPISGIILFFLFHLILICFFFSSHFCLITLPILFFQFHLILICFFFFFSFLSYFTFCIALIYIIHFPFLAYSIFPISFNSHLFFSFFFPFLSYSTLLHCIDLICNLHTT
jgi:hypothetical protein